MKLVAGLGNPGREYAGTRHNIGFDVLKVLSDRFGSPKPKSKFDAEYLEILVGSERVLLLAPQTFMNLSGRSVRKACDFFNLSPADVLIVCDDLNLPLGRLRIRKSGSAGGQKGLANVIQQLGTNEIPRLRIGIDSPPAGRPAADFVLAKFSKSETPLVEAAVESSATAVEVWATEGCDAAMNRFNPLDVRE